MRRHKNRRSLVIYIVVVLIFITIHYLLDLEFFKSWGALTPFLKKVSLSLALIALIVVLSKGIEQLIHTHAGSEGDRYNLLRIVRFLTIVLSLLVIISFLFSSLYTNLVSLGLISLIVGFALQSPITSFIAWLYLIFRRSYSVGDRIQVKGLRGDVIEISYLDTSILECSGDYLGNDRMSGRIIRFPNSLILREEVINYSGPQMPFIWDETALQILYTSDLAFVEKCLLEAAQNDFGQRYPKRKNLRKWKAAVYFRLNTRAWLEAVVSYPVEPVDTTGRRNRILREALPKLNEAPDRVQFPDTPKR